ncbi:tyrosine-type recombinase/integrase [Nocardia sp. alder85J]|uniref:tyrosine-type recombinase/integrase n=1 Tax=Nocardia sp. alder85J TaxID=2862949 RepID=UPI001CD34ABA|nr:site-specific integrase [Nocardia sp. alder85J]MCX4097942.1 site-specific integrase [Nocardia sp. alder85J]
MTTSTEVSQEAIAAARVLLSQMGLSPADLVGSAAPAPTFAEIVPLVAATLSPGTLRTYNTHFTRLLNLWSDRRLDEVSKTDLEEQSRAVQAGARRDRRSGTGSSAAEHFVTATRCVYRYAEDKGWIRPADNPARQVAVPLRRTSNRYAIPSHRLAEINRAVVDTSDDPELDCLLIRLHTETACRVGGVLALRPIDLDPDQCLLYLREKGCSDRWQPVSPTMMRHLLQHAHDRHAPAHGQLLRYSSGRPITRRRYDTLWARVGVELPWVAVQGITTHWLRHTTLTWVERTYSYAIAHAFAGHRDGKGGSVTATYVKASLLEIATAVAVLTGEPHPLVSAHTDQR